MTGTSDPDEPDFGRAEWRALGTYVQLVVADGASLPEARALAVELIEHVDRTCSRFRDDSDLVRANANSGAWTRVDPMLCAAVEAAVRAAAETGGLVDPTLGRSLVAAGYDRDYDVVRLADGPAAIPLPAVVDAWRRVGVDPEGAVLVPFGTALDLGATGKAFAADHVAAEIAAHLGVDCVLSLGGDVAVGIPERPDPLERPGLDGPRDDVPGPVPWQVTISETPDDPPEVAVTLPTGGLATSTVLARRWHRGGSVAHHLLDPATGRPVEPHWRTVSVAARSCLEANTASTAAIVMGARAVDWLVAADESVVARLVSSEGDVTYVGEWHEVEL